MTVAQAEELITLAVLVNTPSRESYPITSYLSKKSTLIIPSKCEQIILFQTTNRVRITQEISTITIAQGHFLSFRWFLSLGFISFILESNSIYWN